MNQKNKAVMKLLVRTLSTFSAVAFGISIYKDRLDAVIIALCAVAMAVHNKQLLFNLN